MSLEGIRKVVNRESDKPLSLSEWLDMPSDPVELMAWVSLLPYKMVVEGTIDLTAVERLVNTTIAEFGDPLASIINLLADGVGCSLKKIRKR